MPELPEVETTIRYIRACMLGHIVKRLTVSHNGETAFNLALAEMQKRIEGRALTALNRTGKWMLFEFEDTRLIGHLRMSGRYKVADHVLPDSHNRVQFHLDNGQVVNYIDQRRFGTLHVVDSFTTHAGLGQLGPDILTRQVTPAYLFTRLHRLKKPIYSALLDQTIVAGLGNIYVNETLHACRIHPLQPSNTISVFQCKQIISRAREILDMALEMKGTTLIDNLYQDPEGNTGEFAKMLKVYGRKHDPDITVLKIGGRSAFVNKHTALKA